MVKMIEEVTSKIRSISQNARPFHPLLQVNVAIVRKLKLYRPNGPRTSSLQKLPKKWPRPA
jgi:hypothetical protein